MLAMNELLKAFSEEDVDENYKNDNDDYDLGKVLEFCGGDTFSKHEIMYSDGKKRIFSFED